MIKPQKNTAARPRFENTFLYSVYDLLFFMAKKKNSDFFSISSPQMNLWRAYPSIKYLLLSLDYYHFLLSVFVYCNQAQVLLEIIVKAVDESKYFARQSRRREKTFFRTRPGQK